MSRPQGGPEGEPGCRYGTVRRVDAGTGTAYVASTCSTHGTEWRTLSECPNMPLWQRERLRPRPKGSRWSR